MMQITKSLTAVRWYGANLPLVGSPLANHVKVVRIINPGGNGFISFNPASGFNSLTQVNTGDDIVVESKTSSISGGGYSLDNGTLPVAQRLSFPAGASTYPFSITPAAGEAGTYKLDSANPATGLSSITYAKTPAGGTSAPVTLPVTLAVGDTLTVTATTAPGTPGFLALITQ
jgi:hypothetical protein